MFLLFFFFLLFKLLYAPAACGFLIFLRPQSNAITAGKFRVSVSFLFLFFCFFLAWPLFCAYIIEVVVVQVFCSDWNMDQFNHCAGFSAASV